MSTLSKPNIPERRFFPCNMVESAMFVPNPKPADLERKRKLSRSLTRRTSFNSHPPRISSLPKFTSRTSDKSTSAFKAAERLPVMETPSSSGNILGIRSKSTSAFNLAITRGSASNCSTRPERSMSTDWPFMTNLLTFKKEGCSFCKSTMPSTSTSNCSNEWGIPAYLACPPVIRKRAWSTGTQFFPYLPFNVPPNLTSPPTSTFWSRFMIVSGTSSSNVFKDGTLTPNAKSTSSKRDSVSARKRPSTPNLMPLTATSALSKT